MFIFTEFNRDRNACNELVDFLKRSGQYHAARELELYNQWTEPLVYSQDVRLTVKKAHTFRQGFNVTEYLSSALIDMKLHLAGDAEIDPRAFEKNELAKLGMPAELPMRHRTPQFGHIFADDGYSAGYYSYLWSEVLDHDAYAWFVEHGGMTRENGQRYRDMILSRGSTEDLGTLYRAFRGRDPSIQPLLQERGLEETPDEQ